MATETVSSDYAVYDEPERATAEESPATETSSSADRAERFLLGFGVGVMAGAILGIALGSLVLGIAFGFVAGTVVGTALGSR